LLKLVFVYSVFWLDAVDSTQQQWWLSVTNCVRQCYGPQSCAFQQYTYMYMYEPSATNQLSQNGRRVIIETSRRRHGGIMKRRRSYQSRAVGSDWYQRRSRQDDVEAWRCMLHGRRWPVIKYQTQTRTARLLRGGVFSPHHATCSRSCRR